MRYSQIKQALREAEIIDEVSMSPTSLEKFANSPEAAGMLMGIEFEMCVPNANTGDDEPEWEYDWDANESAVDIDEIINFFRMGEFSNMSRSDADRARNDLYDEYMDWQSEAAQNYIDENSDDVIEKTREYLQDDARDASNDHHDEFVADAMKELGELLPDDDAAIEERVRDLTLSWMDRWVDEQIEEADSREYENAREAAEQDLRDEWRDTYASQTDWLESIGVDDMQDAHRRWNFDWPHMIDVNYGRGEASVDEVADAFSDGTGFRARGYSGYHSGSRTSQQEQGYFIIEPDGSIDADDGDAGLEFISPAMPLKDGIEMLKKVQTWAKELGCYTNKSTGLHMNISVPNMTIDSLDYVKLALFLGDEHVLKEFGRQYNSYCKSAMKVVKEKIEQNPENATALLAKMKEHLGAAASKLVHSGVTQKYTSINTKDKYVEFRGPGGNYLDEDLTKLTGTALRLAQALRIATDDTAYKQEYAKKLYKLVSPKEGDWTDPNNSVSLFSRYALGEIKKDELVANVRQAQTARKEKKGEDRQFWVMNKDGTGGKQMVFAPTETEAIIKGGKQMGMKREESISKLKADLFREPEALNSTPPEATNIPDSLPTPWQRYIRDTAPRASVSDLVETQRRIESGTYDSALDNASKTFLYNYIDSLIEWNKRKDAGFNKAPESLSQSWIDWVEHTLPRVTVDTANSVRQRIINGGDQLSAPAEAWIIGRIDNELRSRMDQGVVDGNETRWKVTLDIWENTAYRMVEPVYVDADSPRQAKVKAKELFQREAGLDVPLIHMEAIATTQDAGREELEWSVRDGLGRFVGTVNARSSDEAVRIYGSTNDVDSRNYTAALTDDNPPHAARENNREVFDSLPTIWTDYLQDLSGKSDSDLQRIIDNMAAGVNAHYTSLETNQKDFIIGTINMELQRRRAADGTAWTSNNAEPETGDTTRNPVFDTLPEAHRDWLTNIRDHLDTSLINVLRNVSVSTTLNDQQAAYFRIMIKHELRRRGINPDETPVDVAGAAERANDAMSREREEIAQNAAAAQANQEQKWKVGNHTYGREIITAPTREDAIIKFALNNGTNIQRVQEEPGFIAEPYNEVAESVNLIRKLAGLL